MHFTPGKLLVQDIPDCMVLVSLGQCPGLAVNPPCVELLCNTNDAQKAVMAHTIACNDSLGEVNAWHL